MSRFSGHQGRGAGRQFLRNRSEEIQREARELEAEGATKMAVLKAEARIRQAKRVERAVSEVRQADRRTPSGYGLLDLSSREIGGEPIE